MNKSFIVISIDNYLEFNCKFQASLSNDKFIELLV